MPTVILDTTSPHSEEYLEKLEAEIAAFPGYLHPDHPVVLNAKSAKISLATALAETQKSYAEIVAESEAMRPIEGARDRKEREAAEKAKSEADAKLAEIDEKFRARVNSWNTAIQTLRDLRAAKQVTRQRVSGIRASIATGEQGFEMTVTQPGVYGDSSYDIAAGILKHKAILPMFEVAAETASKALDNHVAELARLARSLDVPKENWPEEITNTK